MVNQSQDLCRKFDLIFALATIPEPDIQLLHRATDIPISTIKRQLSILRSSFAMNIVFVREPGTQGGHGCYQISDWGVIDKDRFMKFWATERPRH